MPDKPLWLDRLPEAIRELEQDPDLWVDRPRVDRLLGVGRRRAHQLLAPLADHSIGTSLVARRGDVIAFFQRVAAGEEAWYEGRRRQRLWAELDRTRRAWAEQPRLLVETSEEEIGRIARRDLEGLPEGIELAPGSITLRFATFDEALRQLMALSIAIGRNGRGFEERVAPPPLRD